MITWHLKPFAALSNTELYKILRLRGEVFAVEQNSVFLDCDNRDQVAHHLCGWKNDELVAYSRILPPGIPYAGGASIGRVIVAPSARKQQLGRLLMEKSLEQLYHLYGPVTVIISAQLYLVGFYESFSFVKHGDAYMDDGILHIKMEKAI